MSRGGGMVPSDDACRVIDVFARHFPLADFVFGKATPKATGCPLYDPAGLLKLDPYGYSNGVQAEALVAQCIQPDVPANGSVNHQDDGPLFDQWSVHLQGGYRYLLLPSWPGTGAESADGGQCDGDLRHRRGCFAKLCIGRRLHRVGAAIWESARVRGHVAADERPGDTGGDAPTALHGGASLCGVEVPDFLAPAVRDAGLGTCEGGDGDRDLGLEPEESDESAGRGRAGSDAGSGLRIKPPEKRKVPFGPSFYPVRSPDRDKDCSAPFFVVRWRIA